jgi:RNA polymerase sigma-70 factor, ECF subfamily
MVDLKTYPSAVAAADVCNTTHSCVRAEKAERESANAEIGALLRRIERGDEAAMRALHLRYNRRVYAFVLKRLRDPAEAEEVVVDTMFEIWKHPLRFRGESRFSTWLLGIARNKLLNVIRAREPAHCDIDDESVQLPGHAMDGFAALDKKQRHGLLLSCMQRLPAEQRECLHLALFEELPLKDIAQLQGCPENTVKTRLFHARQKMNRYLRRPALEGSEPNPEIATVFAL